MIITILENNFYIMKNKQGLTIIEVLILFALFVLLFFMWVDSMKKIEEIKEKTNEENMQKQERIINKEENNAMPSSDETKDNKEVLSPIINTEDNKEQKSIIEKQKKYEMPTVNTIMYQDKVLEVKTDNNGKTYFQDADGKVYSANEIN